MNTKSEQVLRRLFWVLQRRLPERTVLRNEVLPVAIPKGGLLILRDGDQGEPEALLSPPRNIYQHRVELEVVVQEKEVVVREAAFDELIGDVQQALSGTDRLGGIVDTLTIGSSEVMTEPLEGAAAMKGAVVPIVVEYVDTPAEIEVTDSLQGPKGVNGLGQYRFYALADDGVLLTIPSTTLMIGNDGHLSAPSNWQSAIPTLAGKSLWVLEGRGKAGEAVIWNVGF